MKSADKAEYRRRREKKTDYKKRLEYLKSKAPRAVIRKTNKKMIVQIVSYSSKGDETISSATSEDLKSFGWKASTGNLPAAYLTGLLCGSRALNEGIKDAIPDLGVQEKQYGTRIFAALKGIKDSGLDIEAKDKIFPSENRIRGEHIEKFAKESSNFTKKEEASKKITEKFEKVKEKIKEDIGE